MSGSASTGCVQRVRQRHLRGGGHPGPVWRAQKPLQSTIVWQREPAQELWGAAWLPWGCVDGVRSLREAGDAVSEMLRFGMSEPEQR